MFRFLSLVLLPLAFGQVAKAAQELPVTTFELDNGLQAVVLEDHRAPVVTHMLWYRVGSADEEPGKSGLAHFLEHLMFKGTDEIPEGAFSKIVAANGGNDNAFTSFDYTGYFQRISADRLELMMKMESDRMTDLVLTDAVVLPERDVIIEERNSRVDTNPGSMFSEERRAAQFLNHRYGIPIIGWRHEIEELTREDALEFYERYYAPNNAILIVAGDVDPAEVRRLAEKYYGVIPRSETLPPRIRPQEPPQKSARRLVFSDERVRQPYVIRTYIAPERNAGDQEDAAAMTMLAELLGGSGLTSFMGQKLQLEQKIAINAGAFYDGNSLDPSGFGIYVVPTPGVDLASAEAAMDAVLQEFIETGPDEEHLARIKTQIRADQIYALDDQSGLARRFGEALTQGLTVEDVLAWPDILQAVTPEDVKRVAGEIFDIRKSVTGWLTTEEPNG